MISFSIRLGEWNLLVLTGKHRGAKGTFPFLPIFELVENHGCLSGQVHFGEVAKKTN